MDSKKMKGFILLVISVLTLFNVYLFQTKKQNCLIRHNLLLQTKDLICSLAFGEGFMEDPFKGENDRETGYESRSEVQYYSYEYTYLHKTIAGEKIYSGKQTPITKVVCKGDGNVACYKGIYPGDTEFLGEVSESERKDR